MVHEELGLKWMGIYEGESVKDSGGSKGGGEGATKEREGNFEKGTKE